MKTPRILAATLALSTPLALGACGSSDDGAGGDTSSTPKSSSSEMSSPSDMSSSSSGSDMSSPSMESSMPPGSAMPAGKPFGPACSGVPMSGKGSFKGMAQDPVATAAGNNPALSTLVMAVKKAGLVDTLNNAPALTVFAPTNDAFKKIPKAQLDKVLNDKKALTTLLTGHVLTGKKDPKQVVGSHKSMAGSTVMVKGSAPNLMVGQGKVGCGDVPTKNATVYIVDTVLMGK